MKRSPCPGPARRFVRQVTAAAIEANVNVIFWGTAMRKNLPVTNVEHLLGDDTLIVSRTDTKGRIVFSQRSVRCSLGVHRSGNDEAAAQYRAPSRHAAGSVR